MDSERFEKVREIFLHVQTLGENEREAYINHVCGDDHLLKAEIQELLTADRDNRALDAPIVSDQAILNVVMQGGSVEFEPRSGTFGNYEIGKHIGHGGMGDVYEAEQKNPKRTVALKFLRPGLISRDQRKRLAMEAQALGKLNHPAIAHIYEAGMNDDEPYFAMELIQGKEMDQYADEHKLSTEQRLELIAKICDGVQHANERGIIHRDLKPSNILVDRHAQPKILDFGISRSVEADHLMTQTIPGSVLGTPAYMSPEQARGDSAQIGTRSDVYSIGVCAFQLLTGKMPYPIEGKDFVQVLKVIAETEPQRPSTIDRHLRGDIETILLKALAKDVRHRYSSAGELAMDIRRHLLHQTIFARPQSTWYQMARFARRNRALVGVLALTAVVLIGGIITTTLWAIRARTAEADNSRALDESRLQLGELAMQRGEWSTAISSYQKAIEAGTAHPIEVKLRLIRSMYSADDRVGANRELDALLDAYPQSANRPDVLFWKGTAAWLTNSDQAAKLFQQAMAGQDGPALSSANREYILGLLSMELEDASTHFRTALAEDRFLYDCYPSLVGTLLLMGKMDEALQVCHDWQLLYPQDAMIGVSNAIIFSIQRKTRESEEAFAKVKNRLEPSTRQRVIVVLDIIKQIEELNPNDAGFSDVIKLSSSVISLANEGNSDKSPEISDIRFPLATRKIMTTGFSLIGQFENPLNLFLDSEEKRFEALKQVADIIPLAELDLRVGERYAVRGDVEHALYYLRRAINTPTLITYPDTTPIAYSWILGVQGPAISRMPRDQIPKAVADFQKETVWPAIKVNAILHTGSSNRRTIIKNCLYLGLEADARVMLSQWLDATRQKPDPAALAFQAQFELECGNYGRSLTAAQDALDLATKLGRQNLIKEYTALRQRAIDNIGKVGSPNAPRSVEEFLHSRTTP